MKAIVYTQYGPPDVLQLKDVAKPEPKENQVLVKVHAASANALDYRRFEKLSTMGRFIEERLVKSAGKILGADIAGFVEAVGANIKQFQLGDQVFGVAAGSAGGFAEYASASENHLALKPASLSFEAAAAVPVAGSARQRTDSNRAKGPHHRRVWRSGHVCGADRQSPGHGSDRRMQFAKPGHGALDRCRSRH